MLGTRQTDDIASDLLARVGAVEVDRFANALAIAGVADPHAAIDLLVRTHRATIIEETIIDTY